MASSSLQRCRTERAALALVLASALLLRLWGLGYDLPYIYHPDEPDKIAMAQRMFQSGDLNPHYFRKPTLVWYLNAAAYVPYYLVQRARGEWASPADLKPPEVLAMGVAKTEQPGTVLLGRSLTVLAGCLVVALTYRLAVQAGATFFWPLLAAILVAVSPTAVRHSRYITVDMFLTAAALAGALLALQLFDRGRQRDYLLAGLAIGVAAACKYPGAVFGIGLVAAHFLRPHGGGWRDRRLAIALLAAPLMFVVCTPYAVLDHSAFLFEARHESRHYTSVGHAGMEGDAPHWYASYALREEGLVTVAGVLAIGVAVWRRDRRQLALATAPVVYLTIISLLAVRNDRTLLPAIPFLVVLAAGLGSDLWQRIGTRLRPMLETQGGAGRTTAAVLLLGAVAIGPPLARTLGEARRLRAPDSRAVAAAWIDQHLPAGSTVAIEPYAPYVDPRRFQVRATRSLAAVDDDWFRQNNVDFVVASEGMYGRFLLEPSRYPEQASRYQQLFRQWLLWRTFRQGEFEIRLYQVTEREPPRAQPPR